MMARLTLSIQHNREPFSPARWAPGGDLQTLAGYLLPGSKGLSHTHLHKIPVSFGDTLVACENLSQEEKAAGVVLLLHGLGGQADSPYMLRVAKKFLDKNWITFRLNHRGAGQGRGLARQLYHAGRSEDLAPMLRLIAENYPDKPVIAIGFSLSGNMLLKLLGEQPEAIPQNLCGALAVSAPIKLAAGAAAISRKRNWLYDRRFISLLKNTLREREIDFPDFPRFELPRNLNLYAFDQIVTAPLGGFTSAEDYYQKCSAHQFLGNIRVPVVLLAAENDPFIPREIFADLPDSPWLQLHLTPSGGHLGFISAKRTAFGDHRWMDYALWHYANALVRQYAQAFKQMA
ncbi:alpha/beta fold hydrolase [Cytophagia bacterium CHB2]|nr:alpha/beta fold hydrolase [Cytophagia bacterium CHB2]